MNFTSIGFPQIVFNKMLSVSCMVAAPVLVVWCWSLGSEGGVPVEGSILIGRRSWSWAGCYRGVPLRRAVLRRWGVGFGGVFPVAPGTVWPRLPSGRTGCTYPGCLYWSGLCGSCACSCFWHCLLFLWCSWMIAHPVFGRKVCSTGMEVKRVRFPAQPQSCLGASRVPASPCCRAVPRARRIVRAGSWRRSSAWC